MSPLDRTLSHDQTDRHTFLPHLNKLFKYFFHVRWVVTWHWVLPRHLIFLVGYYISDLVSAANFIRPDNKINLIQFSCSSHTFNPLNIVKFCTLIQISKKRDALLIRFLLFVRTSSIVFRDNTLLVWVNNMDALLHLRLQHFAVESNANKHRGPKRNSFFLIIQL